MYVTLTMSIPDAKSRVDVLSILNKVLHGESDINTEGISIDGLKITEENKKTMLML